MTLRAGNADVAKVVVQILLTPSASDVADALNPDSDADDGSSASRAARDKLRLLRSMQQSLAQHMGYQAGAHGTANSDSEAASGGAADDAAAGSDLPAARPGLCSPVVTPLGAAPVAQVLVCVHVSFDVRMP